MLQRQEPPLYYGTTKRIALAPGVYSDPLQFPPPPVPGQPRGKPLLAHGVPHPRPALLPAGVLRPPPAPRPALPPAGGAPPAGVHRPLLPPAGIHRPSLPPPGAAPPAGVPHSPPGLPPAGAAISVRAGTAANKIPAPTVLSCLSPGIIKSRARKNLGITTEPVPSEPVYTFGSLHPKNLSETGSYTSLGLSTAGTGTNFEPSVLSNLPNFSFGSFSSERLVDSGKERKDDDSGPSTSAASKGKKSQGGGRRSRTKGRSRSPSPLPTRASTTAARPSYAAAAWQASPWADTPEVKKHKEDLRSYMDECCAVLAKELWEAGSYHIQIEFDDLKSKNKQLAYFIANHLKRFQSSLNLIAKSFLLDNFRNKDDDGRYGNETVDGYTERRARVTFIGIPNSICSLESFIANNKTKRVWLFEDHQDCRHEIPKIEPALRRITQKIVSYVTVGHENGEAWNGDWSPADWEIIDGSVVKLLKDPVDLANREMSIRDLEKISTEVIPKLADTNGNLPAFFEHLREELLTIGKQNMTDKELYGWFYQYLRFHPALMSSKARAKLLQGFYYVAVRLNSNTFECYHAIFSDLGFAQWVQFVHGDWWAIPEVQWRVFWHGKYPPAGTASKDWILPYNGCVGSLLNYNRQILEHSNRHCFCKNVQTMVSSFEPELLAADLYPFFLPEFIKLLFNHNAMEEGESEFVEEWNFYTKSTNYEGN